MSFSLAVRHQLRYFQYLTHPVFSAYYRFAAPAFFFLSPNSLHPYLASPADNNLQYIIWKKKSLYKICHSLSNSILSPNKMAEMSGLNHVPIQNKKKQLHKKISVNSVLSNGNLRETDFSLIFSCDRYFFPPYNYGLPRGIYVSVKLV